MRNPNSDIKLQKIPIPLSQRRRQRIMTILCLPEVHRAFTNPTNHALRHPLPTQSNISKRHRQQHLVRDVVVVLQIRRSVGFEKTITQTLRLLNLEKQQHHFYNPIKNQKQCFRTQPKNVNHPLYPAPLKQQLMMVPYLVTKVRF